MASASVCVVCWGWVCVRFVWVGLFMCSVCYKCTCTSQPPNTSPSPPTHRPHTPHPPPPFPFSHIPCTGACSTITTLSNSSATSSAESAATTSSGLLWGSPISCNTCSMVSRLICSRWASWETVTLAGMMVCWARRRSSAAARAWRRRLWCVCGVCVWGCSAGRVWCGYVVCV